MNFNFFITELLNKMNETKEKCIYENRKMIMYLIIDIISYIFAIFILKKSVLTVIIIFIISIIIFIFLSIKITNKNKKIWEEDKEDIKIIIRKHKTQDYLQLNNWISNTYNELEGSKFKIQKDDYFIAIIVGSILLILGDILSKITGEIANNRNNLEKIVEMSPIWLIVFLPILTLVIISYTISSLYDYRKEMTLKDLKYIKKILVEEENNGIEYKSNRRNVLCILFCPYTKKLDNQNSKQIKNN